MYLSNDGNQVKADIARVFKFHLFSLLSCIYLFFYKMHVKVHKKISTDGNLSTAILSTVGG